MKSVFEAISERHSKRAFLKKPVDRSLLESVLKNAANAGSSKNTQPWEVVVISGHTRDALSKELCRLFDAGLFEKPDFTYGPKLEPESWTARAKACGYALFDLKGIARDDHEARKQHSRENYTFFDAPVEMIFHLPAGAERGTFLDMGQFLQNVMLGLVGHGLASCPQASITAFSATIKRLLGLDPNCIVVCGLAVGYPAESAKVNSFIPARAELAEYVRFLT